MIMNKEYQKLEYPKLIELQNDLTFIIATEIDISFIDKGAVFLRGKCYNYDDAILREVKEMIEICYNTKEDFYCGIDKDGKYID